MLRYFRKIRLHIFVLVFFPFILRVLCAEEQSDCAEIKLYPILAFYLANLYLIPLHNTVRISTCKTKLSANTWRFQEIFKENYLQILHLAGTPDSSIRGFWKTAEPSPTLASKMSRITLKGKAIPKNMIAYCRPVEWAQTYIHTDNTHERGHD